MSENQVSNVSHPAQPPRKTLKDHLKAFGGALALVLMTLVLIEIGIRILDPWGLSYFEDLAKMGNEVFQYDDAQGYIMPDGEYRFSHWSATIADRIRALPDGNPDTDCEIAILGDSVAFAYGVNDADSWLNLIAAELPDVTFKNRGIPRYNSTNVMLTHQVYPDSDAYVYLVIDNDTAAALDLRTEQFSGSGAGMPWLVRYMNFAIYRGGGTDRDETIQPNEDIFPENSDSPELARFFSELDTLTQDSRVYLAAFGGEALSNTIQARGYPVTLFDYPRNNRISYSDYHLNPNGNRELANQALPFFRQVMAEKCPA